MTQTLGKWCQQMVNDEELSFTEYLKFAVVGITPTTTAGKERLRKAVRQRLREDMTDQPDMINHPPHYTSCPAPNRQEKRNFNPFCSKDSWGVLFIFIKSCQPI